MKRILVMSAGLVVLVATMAAAQTPTAPGPQSPAVKGANFVNADGDVYQRDLGPNTARTAAAMRVFDPDASWREVSR